MGPGEITAGYGWAEHTLDETWVAGETLELASRTVTRGVARASSPFLIEATTDVEAATTATFGQRLLSLALLESHRDAALERLAEAPPGLSARILLSHRIDDQREDLTTVIRLENAGESSPIALLTTPRHLSEDLERLIRLGGMPVELERAERDSLAILWSSGAGGVLLHESAGHPAGIAPPVEWPAWLSVLDDPGMQIFELPIGQTGPRRRFDLLSSERPSFQRRASFREHPMPRMSALVATARGGPFPLPDRYIEIELAEGGSWDPLTDRVSVNVLWASLNENGTRRRLAPFPITAPRSRVAQSITGARGEPVRYPGVLCSEYGQRLPVGTWCIDLITEGI